MISQCCVCLVQWVVCVFDPPAVPETMLISCLSSSARTTPYDIICQCRDVPFRDEVCLWDVVADKLIAAMLMLGHSFPLHKVLEGHRMAQFVVERHKEVHDQLVTGKGTGMVVFSVNNPVSAESSFSADAKLTDDDEAPTHRCQRCNRPKKEVSTLSMLMQLCIDVPCLMSHLLYP